MYNTTLLLRFWKCCRDCILDTSQAIGAEMRMSWTPRFFRLFNTDSKYLLLSFSPTTMLRTSFIPSSLIPSTTYAASFLITPSSRTEKCTASLHTHSVDNSTHVGNGFLNTTASNNSNSFNKMYLYNKSTTTNNTSTYSPMYISNSGNTSTTTNYNWYNPVTNNCDLTADEV